MKKAVFLVIFLAFLLLNYIYFSKLEASNLLMNDPVTISDYYYRLPSKYFEEAPDSLLERKKYIISIDQKNNYLEAEKPPEKTDGISFSVKMKLYKKSNGDMLLAVEHSLKGKMIYDDGKPYEGDPTITIWKPDFLEFKNGQWLDVTSKVFPQTSTDKILKMYRLTGDQNYKTDQLKFIIAIYYITKSDESILLRGRENFGSTFSTYYKCVWNGEKFVIKD